MHSSGSTLYISSNFHIPFSLFCNKRIIKLRPKIISSHRHYPGCGLERSSLCLLCNWRRLPRSEEFENILRNMINIENGKSINILECFLALATSRFCRLHEQKLSFLYWDLLTQISPQRNWVPLGLFILNFIYYSEIGWVVLPEMQNQIITILPKCRNWKRYLLNWLVMSWEASNVNYPWKWAQVFILSKSKIENEIKKWCVIFKSNDSLLALEFHTDKFWTKKCLTYKKS